MSVHHTELTRKFFEVFFKMATKAETLEPLYTDDVCASFDLSSIGEEIKKVNNKSDLLEQMSTILPLIPNTCNSFIEQPYEDGKAILTVVATSKAKETPQTFTITFVLKEIEIETHRYGVTHQIVKSL